MTILVIENESVIRFYLTLTLRRINGEVKDFKSCEDAIPHITEDVDLIITDIRLADDEMTGLNLVDYLFEKGCTIPIIVQSGFIDDEILDKYNGKVKAWIRKPIDLNLLENIVRSIKKV
jgi:DNA-binding NtrC family response regulator